MPIDKTCVVCGITFKVPPVRAKTATTCSNKCAYVVRGQSNKRRVTINCARCGKPFEVPFCHRARRRYCSHGCRDGSPDYKALHKQQSTGGGNGNWKGGKTSASGYSMRRVTHPFAANGNGYVMEHRLTIEDVMRRCVPDHPFLVEIDGVRYLRREIHVHHIDGDKCNNAFENLVAMTQVAHWATHHGFTPKQKTYWPEPPNGIFLKGN
jgi:hypothetical protein